MLRILSVVVGLTVAVGVAFALLGWWSQRPEITAPGMVDGRLRGCEPAPHCVCSDSEQTGDTVHWIAPIDLSGAADPAHWHVIRETLAVAGGAVTREDQGYLHATFTSRFFGFVDDLELRADAGRLQVRSSSRVGYSDLGANRARVEDLRQRLAATLGAGHKPG